MFNESREAILLVIGGDKRKDQHASTCVAVVSLTSSLSLSPGI
jgi:hypothetical protein